MLGEQIGETRGKRIVRRVLSSDPLRVEVTFEDSGKMLGIEANGFGTYTSQLRADGTIYGEGEAAYITKDGESVTCKGSGLGKLKEGGAVSAPASGGGDWSYTSTGAGGSVDAAVANRRHILTTHMATPVSDPRWRSRCGGWLA